jgi:hypothetical protein
MFQKVVKSQQETYHTVKNGTQLNIQAPMSTRVVGGVFIGGAANVRVVVIGPSLTQFYPHHPSGTMLGTL